MTEYGVGMRYRWSMLAIGAAPLLLWAFGHSEGRATSLSLNQDGSTVGTGSVPVVVELFTSEGCSSCPPADALLARLESQQPIPHTQVIALEEHVDYWNGDGWTDPFSGREWTARQEEYAYTLKNRNPYTPQMVIDGHTELVGNREGAARQAIAVAGTQAKAHVSIAVQRDFRWRQIRDLAGGHGIRAAFRGECWRKCRLQSASRLGRAHPAQDRIHR
jgi:hypothetical protein